MLLAMQRAVFIKAMPLRALGATAEQAVEICTTIERRVPDLGINSRAMHRPLFAACLPFSSTSFKGMVVQPYNILRCCGGGTLIAALAKTVCNHPSRSRKPSTVSPSLLCSLLAQWTGTAHCNQRGAIAPKFIWNVVAWLWQHGTQSSTLMQRVVKHRKVRSPTALQQDWVWICQSLLTELTPTALHRCDATCRQAMVASVQNADNLWKRAT